MRLHIGVNDKFLQNFIDISTELKLEDENFFVLYGKEEIPFQRELNDKNVHICDELTSIREHLITLIDRSQVIYIHYLSQQVVHFLSEMDIVEKKIVWIFWGNDGFPLVNDKIREIPSWNLRNLLGRIKRLFFKRKNSNAEEKRRFISKINYFAHYIIEDFELLKPLLAKDANFLFFSYGVLEQIVKDNLIEGKDTLIGNSGDATSNHFYVLNSLLSKDMQGNIIVPLGYAGESSYIKQLIEFGNKKFGKNFVPVTKTMNLDSYIKLLSSVQFSIMYHSRPQGWGNIMQLLWQGSKVFMFPSNTLYLFLKRNGFEVFPLTKKIEMMDWSALEKDKKEKNRILLKMHFGKQELLKSYKYLLSI